MRSVITTAVVALLAASCGGGSSADLAGGPAGQGSASPEPTIETPAPEATIAGRLRVTPTGCSLGGLDGPVAIGEVAFTAVNETEDLALFNVARLDEASSFEEFSSHVRKEIRLATAGRAGLGHPSFAVPMFEVLLEAHERGRLVGTVDEPGTYVLTCARVFKEVGELRPAGALGPVEVR